eukprot:GAHX01001158.1.p1 GENE.GAHX01001158.1~~GAHX01001158.1.p1  ORF type:complete len:228 (-),score=54.42 GAHX01001158.1:55-738(-)
MPISTFSDLVKDDSETEALLKESAGSSDVNMLDSDFFEKSQKMPSYTLTHYKNGFLTEQKVFYDKKDPKTASIYSDIEKRVVPRCLEGEIRKKFGNKAENIEFKIDNKTHEIYKVQITKSYKIEAPEYDHKRAFLMLEAVDHEIQEGDAVTIKVNDVQKREKIEIKLMKDWPVLKMYEILKYKFGERINGEGYIEIKGEIPPKLLKIDYRKIGDLNLFNNTVTVYFK